MLTNNRALIVRDRNAPTADEWREQKRREEWEEWKRRRDADMANQIWWGKLAALMVVVTCVLAAVVIIDISREHPQPAKLPPTGPGSEPAPTQRRSEFDDPSPITDEEIMPHQSKYGGFAILDTQTGHYTLRNRITREDVATVGQLRRYQAMLDRRGDRSPSSVFASPKKGETR